MISDELIKLREIPNEKLDKFYNVSMDNYRMLKLQGQLTYETVQIANDLNVPLAWDNNSHVLRGTNENEITICLTL